MERNRHGFLRICIRSGGSAADVVDDDSSALSMMGDVNINKQRGTTVKKKKQRRDAKIKHKKKKKKRERERTISVYLSSL